jgi:5-methylcytosine-specific restriction endonuclease McrA
VNQKQRRRKLERSLELANSYVWTRDLGRCIVCGSKDIVGEPYKGGAHHILSRQSHPSLILCVRNLCLLCRNCHTEEANTKPFARKLLKIMMEKYFYTYKEQEFMEVLNA